MANAYDKEALLEAVQGENPSHSDRLRRAAIAPTSEAVSHLLAVVADLAGVDLEGTDDDDAEAAPAKSSKASKTASDTADADARRRD